jgi:hypothetical protein
LKNQLGNILAAVPGKWQPAGGGLLSKSSYQPSQRLAARLEFLRLLSACSWVRRGWSW